MTEAADTRRCATDARAVLVLRAGVATRRDDRIAVEAPLEIRIAGQPLCITMRTPGDDPDLVAGFLLGEGIVAASEEIAHIGIDALADDADVAHVALATDRRPDHLRRGTLTTSSCGACGAPSLQALRAPLRRFARGPTIAAEILADLPRRMRDAQPLFAATGGVHAAAIFGIDGELRCCREDLGRHNAVDKVVGWALRRGELPLERHVLVVSGRASYEIVQKAQAAGVPIVAAVSAPSTLAIELAERIGQTLVGFVRDGSMNVYAGAERIVPADARGAVKRDPPPASPASPTPP